MSTTPMSPSGFGTDLSRDHPRRDHHRPVHRRQRLSRAQARPHLRDLDPGRGDLDGGAASSSRIRRSRKTTSSRRSPRRRARCRRSSSSCRAWSWSAGGPASPYWLSVAVIALGGILGVMYSVPLRRALVTGSDLPYPGRRRRGRSAQGRRRRRRRRGEPPRPRRDRPRARSSRPPSRSSPRPSSSPPRPRAASAFGAGATTVSTSLSMALIGVGHLVGLAVGIAMLVGLHHRLVRAGAVADRARRPRLGAGLDDARRRRPSARRSASSAPARSASRRSGPCSRSSARSSAGITSAMAASRARRAGGQDSLALTERDIPIGIVGGDHPRLADPDRPAAVGLRAERPDRRRRPG